MSPVWSHPARTVRAFRSGYTNRDCADEKA